MNRPRLTKSIRRGLPAIAAAYRETFAYELQRGSQKRRDVRRALDWIDQIDTWSATRRNGQQESPATSTTNGDTDDEKCS